MSIYTKLLEIQKLHLEFEKDAKNPFFKSNYVSLDSIVSKLTPHLDKQWLLVTHYTTNGNIVTKVVDVAMDKWEFCIESSFPLIQSTDPQKLWSCITYAKRYNLWQLFNIVTDRDDDGNEASKKVEKKELEFMEYIEMIQKENDSNHITTLYTEASSLYNSEKQIEWLKKEARARTDFLTK